VSAQVYYDSPSEAAVVVPVTFTNAAGSVADPTSVSCVVTDPTGTTVTYTYGGSPPDNTILRVSAGNYSLTLSGLTIAGLYVTTWIGTGNSVQQVSPYTVRIVPLSAVGTGMQYWYTGREELKSRLNITDNNSDYEIQLAIQAVTNWISTYTGRHFYQLTETRTYQPSNIWELPIDDVVPSKASAMQVNLDWDGDGIYETAWGTPAPPIGTGQNYTLKLGTPSGYEDNYNVNAAGVPRPYTQLQALMGGVGGNPANGGWLPFVWPYTHLNRVQVITTWGWETVPPSVQQASLLLCTDVFKSKDAPWGVAGTAETGLMRVQSNPWAVELLHDYVNTRRKVGV
jgi:Phage gp6-like head-tail connector protein